MKADSTCVRCVESVRALPPSYGTIEMLLCLVSVRSRWISPSESYEAARGALPGPKKGLSSSCVVQLQAAVHAFRGVPQGRAAGAWDAHAALMDRSRDRYG
eukprot:scaffold15138_cov58-Phaeocystis_antarctica.AAC.1